jgi:hypothetical protein
MIQAEVARCHATGRSSWCAYGAASVSMQNSNKILEENMGGQVEIFQRVKILHMAPDGVMSVGTMEQKSQ